jgi:hypothetical protein
MRDSLEYARKFFKVIKNYAKNAPNEVLKAKFRMLKSSFTRAITILPQPALPKYRLFQIPNIPTTQFKPSLSSSRIKICSKALKFTPKPAPNVSR